MFEPAPKHAIDRIGEEASKALLPIKDFSSAQLDVVGTGFIARLDGLGYLVTAAHTILNTGKKYTGVVLNDKELSLEHRRFYCSREDDIGFFPLDEELAGQVKGVYRIPLKRDLSLFGSTAQGVVVMGYPIHLEPNEKTPVLPLSTQLDSRPLTTMTDLIDPKLYWLDAPSWSSTDGTRTIKDLNPEGMSGGPALAWFNLGTYDKPELAAALQSVLVEWSVREGYLVGSAAARLIALIDAYLAGHLECWSD